MHTRLARGRRRVTTTALTVAMALAIAVPASTLGVARHPNPSFEYVTLTPAAAGGSVVALINSGDEFDGVTFEGIPDGLGVVPVGNGKRYVDLYVAFEQSHVPFQGFADFEDSSVQRARLDLKTMQLTKLDEVLPPSAGFIRFCSAFMAGPDEGFADYTFFLNEESTDVIHVPPGAPYGPDPSTTPFRQAGYSVALNTKTGDFGQIPIAGRHNHENTVIVPGGWSETVALSGDDTFLPPSSQLYMNTAASPEAFVADDGDLWAFRVTGTDAGPVNPANAQNDANDYLEIELGDTWTGEFIHVPDAIARGTTSDGDSLTTTDHPQNALEIWSNENNVFQFVRVEDIAYDPDNPRVVYFTDTGSTRLNEDPATGRLFREASADNVPYFNTDGRVFKMVLNAEDPTTVDALSIVAQGRLAIQLNNPAPPTLPTFTVIDPGMGMRAPDNLDVGHSSLMLQEDASNAKVWRWDLTSTWTHVGTVNHPTAPSAGESSGIIDMSEWLGPGWWALDVQSHVNKDLGPAGLTYETPLGGPVLTYQTRREDGQLLLMHVPGS